MTQLAMVCLLASSVAWGGSFHVKRYHPHAKGLNKTAKSKEKMRAYPHISHSAHNTPIPGSVDLSRQVSPPENQGECGCCWAFSLTKALRSEYMVAGEDPGELEFNYLLNNCGPGPQMNGCNGGDFTAAQSFEGGAGPGLNRFDFFTGQTSYFCPHLPVRATAINYNMLGEGGSSPTFKDIAVAIGVKHHVLSTDVAARKGDWENYSGGVYDGCTGNASDVDHMINLIGYDCETSIDSQGNCLFDLSGKPVNGDGYLWVMNNWGTDWGTEAQVGHAGYMKTRMYDKQGNHCNAIATDALFFEINQKPIPILTPPNPDLIPHPCSGFLCPETGCIWSWCVDLPKKEDL